MPIFIFLVIFCIWLSYELKKNTQIAAKQQESFWQAETEANKTRKQDIEHLDYIYLDLTKLPFDKNATDPIKGFQETLDSYSTRKMLNLSGLSNTELKAAYGAANLDALTVCDNNYIKVISTLARWGEELYNHENYTDAQTIFEYSINIGSDVKKVFVLLAEIYYMERNYDRIESLIMMANQLNSLTKDATLRDLNEIFHRN